MQANSSCQKVWLNSEDRNKDRFKNWKFCGLWKLALCHYRAANLAHRTAFDFETFGSNPFVPSLVNTNPMYLNAHMQNALPWAS